MKRTICIWLAFVVVFGLSMFPPWTETWIRSGGLHPPSRELWHAPIFSPPKIADSYWSPEVDYRRMLVEIAVGECFVLALYFTWGRTGENR